MHPATHISGLKACRHSMKAPGICLCLFFTAYCRSVQTHGRASLLSLIRRTAGLRGLRLRSATGLCLCLCLCLFSCLLPTQKLLLFRHTAGLRGLRLRSATGFCLCLCLCLFSLPTAYCLLLTFTLFPPTFNTYFQLLTHEK